MKTIDPDRMTKAELDQLYAEAELVTHENTRPLTAADKRFLAQAERKAIKAGRPRIGKGARRINITVEESLLVNADRYARVHGLTRAAVVAEGLKRVLAA